MQELAAHNKHGRASPTSQVRYLARAGGTVLTDGLTVKRPAALGAHPMAQF